MDDGADDVGAAAAAPGVEASDMTLDEVTKMSKVWHTVLSMLVDRGYHIPVEKLNLSLEAFKQQFVEDDESGRRTQIKEDDLNIVARIADDPTVDYGVLLPRDEDGRHHVGCIRRESKKNQLSLYDHRAVPLDDNPVPHKDARTGNAAALSYRDIHRG